MVADTEHYNRLTSLRSNSRMKMKSYQPGMILCRKESPKPKYKSPDFTPELMKLKNKSVDWKGPTRMLQRNEIEVVGQMNNYTMR